jgi:uncharacterized small protein (DUF1192 family)
MRPNRKPTEDAAARRLRRQQERRRVLRDIQQCIEGTFEHEEWVPELKGCFVRFASVMNRHRAREEKSMYHELPSSFPQLTHRIDALRREHDRVGTELNALSDSVDHLGDSATPSVTGFKNRVTRLVEDIERLEDKETELLQSAYWREDGVSG